VEFSADDSWAPLVAIEGPQADRVLVAVMGESVTDLPPFAHRQLTFDGAKIRAVVATHTGERGYLLYGNPAVGARLWEHCRAAGAEPVGMEALDVLRLEAGIPCCGRDFDEDTLISEVGLETAISYKKGCYLGQEVVERVAARGQVQRKLVGMVCDGPHVPPSDTKLMHNGKEVGWITSAVRSPARQAIIALGYARRECWDVGMEMQVTLAEGGESARVVALPFFANRT
jgi:aminomethyltransferase